jgi:cysteine synthase
MALSSSAEPAARVHHPGNVYGSEWDAIGSTPLIRLNAAALEEIGCLFLGKCVFANAAGGQSVKERAAKSIIADAEASGSLRPGGTVVESTAGGTEIALAVAGLARARGYKAVFVILCSQSQEKNNMLRHAGAEVIEVSPNRHRIQITMWLTVGGLPMSSMKGPCTWISSTAKRTDVPSLIYYT